jgi:hypothetical protein
MIRTAFATYLRAPDGGSGTGGDGGAGGGTGGDKGGTGNAPVRPVTVPEKFWDPATSTVKLDDMGKSYTELEGLVGRRATEYTSDDFNKLVDVKVTGMKDQIKKDALTALRGEAPKSVDAYKLEVAPEVLNLLPESSRDLVALDKDPLVTWWKENCLAMGMGQAQFAAGVSSYLAMQGKNRQAITAAEIARLGESGKVRIDAVGKWIDANLPPEQAKALKAITTNADTVSALETIMKKSGDRSVTAGLTNDAGSTGGPALRSMADVRQAKMDPRYHDPARRDLAYVANIDAAVARLNPD